MEEYLKLDEDGQVEFKSSAKAFTRLYALPVPGTALREPPLGEALRYS